MQDTFISGADDATREAAATARRPEITCLTSLRAVAALEVVLLHTLFELGGKKAQELPRVAISLLTRGGAAVSFFFVLSGFILAYTYATEAGIKGTRRKFWRARFARIYPLYALGFLLDAPRVVSFFLASATSLAGAAMKIAIAGFAYLSLLQSWHPRVTNTWNTPGWSLSTEAFFYAVFPALQRLTRRWPIRLLLVAALGIWLLPLLAFGVLTHFRWVDSSQAGFQTFWRSCPPLHLPEFVLGVVAGRLLLSGCLAGREVALKWLGMGAMGAIVLFAARPGLIPSELELSVLAPLFAVVILALGSRALATFDWLNGSLPVLLGRASYAVYILHQPLKGVFLAVARRLGLDSPSPALLIAFLVFLELTCVALFLYFEDPLRRLITKPAPQSSRQ